MLTTAICIMLNNSLISKIYFPQCVLFSKITHLQKLHRSHRHNKHLEKWNTGKGGGSSWMLLNFCFLTVQKKQVMKSPFFWSWDLSLKRNELFFKKIFHDSKLQVNTMSLNIPKFWKKLVLSRTLKKIPVISKSLCTS